MYYYELSKREKKIARACIDKGLDAEFKEGLEKFATITTNWKEGKYSTNREAYHELFGAVEEKNEQIAGRYDNLGGSKYLIIVVHILNDGYITEDGIKDFSEETKITIQRVMHLIRK